MALWRRDQIRFDLEDANTQHPVAVVKIETPAGGLSVIAEVVRLAGTLMLLGLMSKAKRSRSTPLVPATCA